MRRVSRPSIVLLSAALGVIAASGGFVVSSSAAPPRGLTIGPNAGDKATKAEEKPQPPPPSADDLYRRLKNARSAGVANRVAAEIQMRWLQSGSDTVDLLMQRAMAAIAAKDVALAQDLLDSVITLKPDYAEAWNQRAVLHFGQREFDAAIEDVDVVLRLEPRHYGALVGLATILGEYGYKERALDAYRRALALHPFLKDVAKKIDELAIEVEGRKS